MYTKNQEMRITKQRSITRMKNKPFKVECKGGNTNSSNKVTIYNEGKDEKATNQYDP